jgi:hypothetical protein
MSGGQTLHVLADAKGDIIAVALVQSETTQANEVQSQITPLEGQPLVIVSNLSELGALETAEDFRRLIGDFHVPHGRQELMRRQGRAP